jgi:hypothetical protein
LPKRQHVSQNGRSPGIDPTAIAMTLGWRAHGVPSALTRPRPVAAHEWEGCRVRRYPEVRMSMRFGG